MFARLTVVFLAGFAVACTPVPPADTASVGPYDFGSNQDAELTAIQISSWALADPARTRNDPVDAARALAGVDYMAGRLSSSPRWAQISPLWKQQMLQARIETRQAIGVAPGARSQDVVDGLLRAAAAMQAGRPGDTQAALSAPVFTLGATETYRRLLGLPFLRTANIATAHINGSLNGRNDRGCAGCG